MSNKSFDELSIPFPRDKRDMKVIFFYFIKNATHLNIYLVIESITNTLDFFTCGLNKGNNFFRKLIKCALTNPFTHSSVNTLSGKTMAKIRHSLISYMEIGIKN